MIQAHFHNNYTILRKIIKMDNDCEGVIYQSAKLNRN